MSSSKRLFLVDGNAIAYRSYYAFIQRPLTNAKGQNTSAVYGFVTFLNRILTQEAPDYIAVVFDTGAPTFRHKEYKEYKATRQKMPEDLFSQLAIIKDVVTAYKIPVLEMDGFEADDIIGTLAKRAESEGALSFLVTPDKDFMQLVSKKTKESETVYDAHGNIIEEIQYINNKVDTHFQYQYDASDNKIKELELDGSGKVTKTSEYKFDKGLRIEKTIAGADGKVKTKKTYVYTTF